MLIEKSFDLTFNFLFEDERSLFMFLAFLFIAGSVKKDSHGGKNSLLYVT